jgi:hypothetical protein
MSRTHLLLALVLVHLVLPRLIECVLVMRPDETPVRLVASESETQHLLRLQQLVPGVTYEVRVSYVSTTPCAFRIRLADEAASTGRHLLNVEKLLFVIASGDSVDVVIDADLSDYLSSNSGGGGDGDGSSGDARQVEFLVALESTFRGVPFGVAWLGGLLAVSGVALACAWSRLLSAIRTLARNKTA